MNLERLKRVTVEEGRCEGRPCIRGLRIRVSDILDLLAAGESYEEILADYPFLERGFGAAWCPLCGREPSGGGPWVASRMRDYIVLFPCGECGGDASILILRRP